MADACYCIGRRNAERRRLSQARQCAAGVGAGYDDSICQFVLEECDRVRFGKAERYSSVMLTWVLGVREWI